MMKKLALVMVALLMVTSVASATPTSSIGDGLKLEVFVTDQGDGTWEYQYDISGKYTRGYAWYTPFNMQFDFGDDNASTVDDNFLNMYDTGAGMELHEFWTMDGVSGNRGGAPWWNPSAFPYTGYQPSYGDLATDTWVVLPSVAEAAAEHWNVDPTYALAEGFANPFHLPSDYAIHMGTNPLANTSPETFTDHEPNFGIFAGIEFDADGDGNGDDLQLGWGTPDGGPYPGPGVFWGGDNVTYWLLATIRIVSDLGPNGTVDLQHYTGGTHMLGEPIVGPGVPEPATMSLLALGGLAVLRRRRK
jgi:hypothetical protein